MCTNLNCSCPDCVNNINLSLVSLINDKFKLDFSCITNQHANLLKYVNTHVDDLTLNRDRFLHNVLSTIDVSLVQLVYNNKYISDNIAKYLLMCSQSNIDTFFLHLTADCMLAAAEEETSYIENIFYEFIKYWYNISKTMLDEIIKMIIEKTHSIKFDRHHFIITQIGTKI